MTLLLCGCASSVELACDDAECDASCKTDEYPSGVCDAQGCSCIPTFDGSEDDHAGDDDDTSQSDTDAGTGLAVLAEVSLPTAVGTGYDVLTWSGGEGLTISFTAEFVGTNGAEQAEKLRLTCRRDAWKDASSPPRWQLYYGKRVIPVVVESCDLEDTLFDKKLNAMKVTASVSLRKWRQYAIVTRA